jgi:hypothetical protein
MVFICEYLFIAGGSFTSSLALFSSHLCEGRRGVAMLERERQRERERVRVRRTKIT